MTDQPAEQPTDPTDLSDPAARPAAAVEIPPAGPDGPVGGHALDPAALAATGIVPATTDDPAEARRLVERHGAAVLEGWPTDTEGARSVALAVWGEIAVAVPEPAPVRSGGVYDQVKRESDERLWLHSDGFAYGDHAPDGLVLLCVQDGATGGESFLADGLALLDALATADPELHAFLHEVPVDQTEPGMRTVVSPIVLTLASGRRAVRQPLFVQPAPGSADPARDAELIARWQRVTHDASLAVPRFTLRPGQAAVVDNLRVLHGRDPYDGERFLWRIWCWTTAGNGTPEGQLASDTRYAWVEA